MSCSLKTGGDGKQPTGGCIGTETFSREKFLGRNSIKTEEASTLLQPSASTYKTRSCQALGEAASGEQKQTNRPSTSFFIKNEVQLLSSRARSIKYQ